MATKKTILKTIRVQEPTWTKLNRLKKTTKAHSIDEVLQKLMEEK